MQTDKEFEDLIRRKMAELDEAPPADGWKKITADIKPPRKRRPVWWWLGSLLLLLTGLGTAVYYFTDEEKAVLPTVASVTKIPQTGAPNPDPTKNKTENTNQTIALGSQPANKSNDILRNQSPGSKAKLINTAAPKPGKDSEIILEETAQTGQPRTESMVVTQETTRPTTPQNAGGLNIITSPDSVNRQPDQSLPGTAADRMPLTLAKTDSSVNLVKPVLPDSVLLAAKKDSVKTAVAQLPPTEEKKNKPKAWEAGITFASRYAFRKFMPNGADEIFITKVTPRNQSHPERLGYELGLNVSRAITENLFIETGLAWLKLQEDLSYTYTTGTIDSIIVTGTGTGQTHVNPFYKMEERRLASVYSYGGWRLGATYYFWDNGQRRFNFSMAAGINLLLKGKTTEYRNNTYLTTIEFPSKENILEQSNYNFLVGVGYNTRLGQKYDLMLMPSLNYFMGSTFKEREPLGLRPYSLGLNLTFKRRYNIQNQLPQTRR